MLSPSRRVASVALLAGAAFLAADGAPAQSLTVEGFQVESSFRANTLLGGSYPNSETGMGAQAAARHVWPSGVSVALGGIYAQPEDLSLPDDNPRKFMEQYGPYAEVRYQIPDLEVVRPHAGVRLGWSTLRAEHLPDATGSGVAAGLVAGTEVWATERFGFRVSSVASAFRAPGFVQGFNNSGQDWSVEIGVTYLFGEVSRDADGDGVPDDEDACPETPGGLEVTGDGCLPDSDADGRPDIRDACPATPEGAPVDERGCARDGDGDGVPDARDECPGTREGQPVDEQGCVTDADGDGVADGLDACPDTPAGSEVGPRGCALDEDGDGVPDGRDQCPATVREAVAGENGCSEAQASLRDGRFTLTGLPFRFREVQVNQELEVQLEQIGAELQRDPDLSLEIRVHTDTVGPTQYNQEMSQRLAEAARDFLLRRYPDLTRSRVQASGMGEAEVGDGGEGAGEAVGSSRVVFVVRGRGEGGGGG